MSLLDEARDAPIVADVVVLNPEVRDALVELADKARAFVATTSYYRQSKDSRPEFEEFALALERLRR